MSSIKKLWKTLRILLLLGIYFSKNVAAQENIGCLFAESLCIEHEEWCHDDLVFGKCLPQYGLQPKDLISDPLNEEESGILATMLEDLQGAGLGWDHPFVQCQMQGALKAIRSDTYMLKNLCAELAPAPEVLARQSPIAVVRFTPPSDDYADEVYYPPAAKKAFDDRFYASKTYGLIPNEDVEIDMDDDIFDSVYPISANDELKNRKKDIKNRIELRRMMSEYKAGYLKPPIYYKNGMYEDPEVDYDEKNDDIQTNGLYIAEDKRVAEPLRERQEMARNNEILNLIEHLHKTPKNGVNHQGQPKTSFREKIVKNDEFLNEINHLHRSSKQKKDEKPQVVPKTVFREKLVKNDDISHLLERLHKTSKKDEKIQTSFRQVKNDDILNILEHLHKTEKKDQKQNLEPKTSFREVSRELHIPVESSYHDPITEEAHEDMFSIQNRNRLANTNFLEKADDNIIDNSININNNLPASESGVYTEGGLVYVPDSDEKKDLDSKAEARSLLRDIMGFTRHERLDVKKPGPPAAPPPSAISTDEIQAHLDSLNKEVLPEHLRSGDANKFKKVIVDHIDDEDHAPHSVDTEYTHVIFKNPIDSWSEGVRIVTAIAEMLNIKLSHLRVDRREVSFRVDPNPEKKTATQVAKVINDDRFKNNLSRRIGIIVIRAGVGDKVSDTKEPLPLVHTLKVIDSNENPDVIHVIAYIAAGAGAAAIIVIIVVLFLVNKNDHTREKLGGLQSGIVGAESCTKDYQELCRARMAGKSNIESTPGRIASLSKESDVRPPSSRSSTSSWSEEPALTNMDISTGHMVLSYMEDHLRNKGRLQREWEALCRYEAEPSAREAALQPQCSVLNRAGSPLPFDHSRVVLNHLTNAEAMDYVNASTITDHDPRAPAYVAAQGPLSSTLAHFWQMIWEQGAVVIVALCRLQENNESSCARYWPEEGSEVYHIYEVHLVSEHIWCDDYLVRSFYLKNLRTSETRTVTQFHFLSWPIGGVPSSAKALLEFRRKVNKSYRGRSCPIVVHSSNGAGRTGAYILLDLVLARMNKGAREIDIAATLEHLRDQRAGLVATRQQFEFVLMAVAEEVHAILKALPANTSSEKRELEKVDKETIKEKNEDVTVKTTKANEK